MKKSLWLFTIVVLSFVTAWLLFKIIHSAPNSNSETKSVALRGASSYTPYDAISMVWAKQDDNREMVWTSSGGESGRLLVSQADTRRRPDWVLCTQGVVAGLAARGKDICIIGTVYISDDAILPVFKTPKKPIAGSKSLFIPRSSIEFAFDQLLEREGVSRTDVIVPKVEKVGFVTIAALLAKPSNDKDAIDFGILVDPFITNLIKEQPERFIVGKGGLYEMHYSIVVGAKDLEERRKEFITLLRQLVDADKEIGRLRTDEEFYLKVWGRKKDGKPDYLPFMSTYSRKPARLQLRVRDLRKNLQNEIEYLLAKYPNELSAPKDINALVDASLLKEVAPERVYP